MGKSPRFLLIPRWERTGGPFHTQPNSVQSIVHYYKVNTVGPVTLFQATRALLQASRTGNPTFVAVTSGLGSISGMDRLSGFESVWSPYGATKAALNWFMRRIHFDEPWLTTFVINPGVVKTDMMAGVGPLVENAELFGAITVETSATSILRVIDADSREMSGTFKDHDGSDLPW